MALLSIVLSAVGCSTSPPSKPAQPAAVALSLETPSAVSVQHHPLGKQLELAGFRIGEQAAGKLKIRFGVINHSDADITDLGLKVSLKLITAKPTDPPICVFEVKVPDLGPQEMKEVMGTASTKLRVYELPDWQFIHADFEITSPPAS
ncbi:MAG: hypothetical protein ABI165_02120 [Bryobacteraceae bacterium]